jgi:hypothetical protein
MARSQKPRKQYKPRMVRAPMLVGASLVVSPIEAIFEQISADGTVNVDQRGTPQFMATDGKWYATAPALEGLVYHLEMLSARRGLQLPIEPIKQLQIAMEYSVPVTSLLMQKLKDSLPIIRKTLSFANPDEQLDILRSAQIKFELERLAA